MRTICIGDIHGCSDELNTILIDINPQPTDLIITMGDYVDRGPNGRKVIEQLLKLREQCNTIFLKGNHEEMFLEALDCGQESYLWLQCGSPKTIASYGSLTAVPKSHREFLNNLQLFHETETHIFVHANYDPTKDLADTDTDILLWTHLERRHQRPHHSGKIVVVGHTPQFNGELLDLGFLVCVDTYCFGGGKLTAYDIHSKQIWQVNSKVSHA